MKSKKALSLVLPLCLVVALLFTFAVTGTAADKPDNGVNLTVGDNIVSHYYIDTAYYKAQGCDALQYTYNGTSNQQDYTSVTSPMISLAETDAKYEITATQAAAQIAEPTVIHVYKGGAVFDTVSYSTKTYCDNIIAMNDETLLEYTGRPIKLNTLCKSIIAYAKAAQALFPDYMSKPGAVAITDDYSDDLGLSTVSYTPNIQLKQGTAVRFTKASFICASSAGMRFYFNASGSYGDPIVSGPDDITWSKGNAYIQINGIKPVFFDEAITVTYGDASISMNVLDYAGTVLGNSASAETQQALAKALLVHNDSADAYFETHTLELVPAVAATCTEAGNKAYYRCTECGQLCADADGEVEITEADTVVAALGHNYNTQVTAPTCTAQGFTTYTCTRCGDTYKADYTDAKGHTPVTDAAVAATCTATGLSEGSHCSVCNTVLTAQTATPALGHNYGAPVWAWTGNDNSGYTAAVATFTCANDASHKQSVNDNSIDYAVTTAPQVGVEGEGTYTASVSFNNKTYTDTKTVVIPALVQKATFTHADRLANTDTCLYRAGNSNTIKLGTLFKADSGTPNSADVSVSIAAADSANTSVAGTFTKNTTDWTQGTVKFTGEGVANVTIKEGDGETYTLPLEVINGKNVVAYSELSTGGVNVLLNNIALSSGAMPVISGTIYGNGFTIDASAGLTTKTGIIQLNNAKLDNIVINGPVQNTYVDSFGNAGYASTVVSEGNGTIITNCRITGGQSPLRINSVATVKDTVVSGGCFTNVDVRGGELTIENLTTVNTQNGLAITVANGASSATTITIEGTLTQHNFINENASMSNENANLLKNKMFSSNYSKYQFSSDGVKYINTGIVSMSPNFGGSNITDNRSNKLNYSGMVANIAGTNGYLYTMQNTDPSMLETSYTEPAYTGVQKYYEPAFTWAVPSGDNVPAGGDAHCYKDNAGVLQIQFLTGNSKTLSAASLATIKKYGKKVIIPSSITCTGPAGTAVAVTNGNVTFTTAGQYTLYYTYTDNCIFNQNGELTAQTITYTKTITVNVAVKKQAPNAVITSSADTGTIAWGKAGTSFDPDYNPCIPFLNGLTIKDYDANGNEYTVLDGSSQTGFISSIASCSVSGTTATITLANGTKLVVKGPTVDGSVQIKHYNNILYYCDSTADNNPAAFTKSFAKNAYTYTGENGVAVSYGTARSFTSTASTTTIANYSSMTTAGNGNKFLMFDAQGGTVSPSYTGTSPATLPTPVREGYSFLNWNTKADGTGTARNAGTSMAFSATTTLYAIWKENPVVTFNACGGSSTDPISGTIGSSATLPASTFSGEWLVGWFTEEDGGTKVGNAGDSFTLPAEDTTYYAHWSAAYTVAYNANGGTVAVPGAIYGGTALTLPTPTNGSLTFEGWFTAAEGGTKIGTAGDSYTPTANTELFAHWSQNILVTFDANGGTADTNAETYDHVTPIILPNAERPGHHFDGWFTETSGGTKIGNAGESYAPAANITLHAQWTAYTVSYNADGGSASPAAASGVVTLPSPGTKTGYDFGGWYDGSTLAGNEGDSYTPSANVTLKAKWNVQSYIVSISTSNSTTAVTVNGTTVSNGDSVAYGSVVKVVLTYSQTESKTFTIKQGNNDVTYYSNEACTSLTTATAAGTYYFKMPAGNVTINSSSTKASSGGCITGDTLITLADGSQKRVDALTGDEMLLVWNLETGKYDAAPMVFIDSDPAEDYTVIHACFSDGSEVKIVSEHGFFDLDLGKYVYINEETISDYIGHRFVKQADIDSNTWDVVTLENVWTDTQNVKVYSPTTYKHLCYYTNGMLSMPGGIAGMFNIFDVDVNTMQYDAEKMAADIEQYGLFSYDDFAGIIPENAYRAFNGAWLKVAIEKDLITWDYIEYLADRYSVYF